MSREDTCLSPVATVFGVLLLLGGCNGDGGRVDESSEAQELLREHLIRDHGYYTVGGTVTGLKGSSLVLQNNGGDDLTVVADGAFTFATALRDGSGYAVTVRGSTATPGQACTIGNGSGTVAGAHVDNVKIVCDGPSEPNAAAVGDGRPQAGTADAPPPSETPDSDLKDEDESAVSPGPTPATRRYAYVAGKADVSQYTIGADGALTPMTPARVAIFSPHEGRAEQSANSCSVHPSGRYLYVANFFGWDGLSQYNVGADGGLKPMTPPTVDVAGNAADVTIDPSGRYAYVAGFTGTVSQYAIGADGTLAPMTPSTVAAGTQPHSITVDPSGRYAYVANAGSDDVSQYTLGAEGTLTPMTPPTVPAGKRPHSITVDPSGRYAYVANFGSNDVSQYGVGADGSLAPMSPATVVAGTNPWSVTVDPSGRYAYVANANSSNVSQYTIEDGSLTPMDPATVATGEYGAQWIAVDPAGRHVYVANANSNSNNVSQFQIGAAGGLTPMAARTVAAGEEPKCVVVWAGRP